MREFLDWANGGGKMDAIITQVGVLEQSKGAGELGTTIQLCVPPDSGYHVISSLAILLP